MKFVGTLQLPGDKSISHRAIMLSTIADGVSYVRNLNDGEDLQSTINILKPVSYTHLTLPTKRIV